jgi:hypothetical protein
MASTSFADVLPTQTTRTIAVAVLAVVAATSVGACGSSSASDRDPYVPSANRITSTPTATARSKETEMETSVNRRTTPTRRTTPHSSPAPRPRPTTVRGSVPAILVGTWGGGSSGETAGTSYTFTSDGRFQIRRYRASITGIAVARGSTITFYFNGKSVMSSYSVSELPELYGYRSLNLQIDGYSYVRDI